MHHPCQCTLLAVRNLQGEYMLAGLLFELHRGHHRTPVLYSVFAQTLKLTHGIIAGLMSQSVPGSWDAYVGLCSLTALKALSAVVTTLQPVKIDRLGALGEALAGWMEAAATACMVALQRYYQVPTCTKGYHGHMHCTMFLLQFLEHMTLSFCKYRSYFMQDGEEVDVNVYAKALENNGFEAGTEGALQMAVLVFSILAVVFNLLWIWGFIILRILGLLYVKKQVCLSNW